MINIKKHLGICSIEANNGWYIMWEGAFAAAMLFYWRYKNNLSGKKAT